MNKNARASTISSDSNDQAYARFINDEKRKEVTRKQKHGKNAKFRYGIDHRTISGWIGSHGILVLNSKLSLKCEDCGEWKPRFSSKAREHINSSCQLVPPTVFLLLFFFNYYY